MEKRKRGVPWNSVSSVSGIASVQRGSKRLVEEVARLWLRVKGIQASPGFSHNMIDWNSEEQRMTVKLMEQQFWAICSIDAVGRQRHGAQEVVDAERAVGEPSENIRVSLSYGGGNDGRESNKTAQKATGRAEAESSLKRTLDGRIVKGGGYVGESYSGTAQINK